ncbi:MAG TPA: prepilin peptidase [Solirubrobacteraceae bacterium]|nr:prepilin peptidase [Solirubrobacteraceae bacterium]
MTSRTHILAAVAGALVFLALGASLALDALTLARFAVLGGALGLLVVYDVREHRIPNRIVLPAAGVCAVLSLIGGVRLGHLLAGVVLFLALLVIALVLPRTLGMGDVKLVLLLLCGLDGATTRAVIFGIALLALLAVPLVLRRGRAVLGSALPLAPFLTAGSLLALLR